MGSLPLACRRPGLATAARSAADVKRPATEWAAFLWRAAGQAWPPRHGVLLMYKGSMPIEMAFSWSRFLLAFLLRLRFFWRYDET
jgi:hypothetical protein